MYSLCAVVSISLGRKLHGNSAVQGGALLSVVHSVHMSYKGLETSACWPS